MDKFIRGLVKYTIGAMVVIFLRIFISANTFVPEVLELCNGNYSEAMFYTFFAVLWIGLVIGWFISSIIFILDNL